MPGLQNILPHLPQLLGMLQQATGDAKPPEEPLQIHFPKRHKPAVERALMDHPGKTDAMQEAATPRAATPATSPTPSSALVPKSNDSTTVIIGVSWINRYVVSLYPLPIFGVAIAAPFCGPVFSILQLITVRVLEVPMNAI